MFIGLKKAPIRIHYQFKSWTAFSGWHLTKSVIYLPPFGKELKSYWPLWCCLFTLWPSMKKVVSLAAVFSIVIQRSLKVEANQNTAFDRRCISRQKHKRAKPFGWTWALKRSWKLTCLRTGCSLSHFFFWIKGPFVIQTVHSTFQILHFWGQDMSFLWLFNHLLSWLKSSTLKMFLKIWKFVIVTFRRWVEREKPSSFVYFCHKGCKILGHYWLWCGAQEAPWHLTLHQSCAAFVLIIEIA